MGKNNIMLAYNPQINRGDIAQSPGGPAWEDLMAHIAPSHHQKK